MNQTSIQKGTHFICGPINEKINVLKVYEIYKEKENVLNAFGLLTYNPMTFHQTALIDEFSLNKYFSLQVSCLALCSTLVTIPGWEDCPEANKLVSIAHIMAKEVVPYSKIVLNREAV